MFTGSMMKLKSILYGTLPFYYTKVFEPSSPKLAYYDYFRKRGYTRYPYDFAAEYLEMSIAVQWDKEKELPYVMHREVNDYIFRESIAHLRSRNAIGLC